MAQLDQLESAGTHFRCVEAHRARCHSLIDPRPINPSPRPLPHLNSLPRTALTVARLVGTGLADRKVEARALGNLAMVHVKLDEGAQAIARYRECLALVNLTAAFNSKEDMKKKVRGAFVLLTQHHPRLHSTHHTKPGPSLSTRFLTASRSSAWIWAG